MATLTVTDLSDNANDTGSLRYAVANAANGDAIVFAPGLTGTIPLTSTLSITTGLSIDGGGVITISGQSKYGDFNIDPGANNTVSLANLSINNGNSTGANGSGNNTQNPTIAGSGNNAGGGIYASSGSTILQNDQFSNDRAAGGTGANAGDQNGNNFDKAAGSGGNAAGAVYIDSGATLTSATNLTFTNDTATAGTGGASDAANPTPGANGTAYPTSNNAAVNNAAVCYCTGTLIRTARGDVAVEYLAVGDLAVTTSGAHRPISWIGSRLTQCRRHPRPQEAMPIRIAAHAFAENRPARDLVVSPGHSLCVNVVGEVLIPAGVLVNGTTITQEDVDTVTYWHVELEGGHDILLAENMPAESYLEMGNRSFFAESGVVALDASPDAPIVTHADFCRPFHVEGALVEVVRAQLAARAMTLGWRLEEQGLGDLHLLVDGVRVEPRVRGLSARFAVPAGAESVWLVSGTAVPAQIFVGLPDRRALGLCVAALTLDDGFGAPRCIAMTDPRLCVGFHAVEHDGDANRRWTAGRARLPASLWEGLDNDTFLRVDLAQPALPRWVAPQVAELAQIEPPRLVAEG